VILLDTNVLSEVVKPRPDAQVLRWLSAQEPLSIFTTAITQAEVLFGIEDMPNGKRKLALAAAMERMFAEEFRDRILAFDEDAAPWFARFVASRKSAGHEMSQMDGMIAAVARRHKATLATRNIKDFQDCGLRLIDPWTT